MIIMTTTIMFKTNERMAMTNMMMMRISHCSDLQLRARIMVGCSFDSNTACRNFVVLFM